MKSVIRFKFVCKFWDSLITTPYFISSHLNVNNKDSHDNANGYVIHMGSSRSSDRQVRTVALDRTFDRISKVQIPQIFLLILSEWSVSCNGLLCFANYGPRKAIYFCNPSIRKFKTLPEPCLGHLKHVSLGFAYHSENND